MIGYLLYVYRNHMLYFDKILHFENILFKKIQLSNYSGHVQS